MAAPLISCVTLFTLSMSALIFLCAPLCVLCVSVVSINKAIAHFRTKTQNTNFNCANSEYKGFAGLITAGSQKSPMFGGQLRDLFVKMSRKPSPVCSVDAQNVNCPVLMRKGRYWTHTL